MDILQVTLKSVLAELHALILNLAKTRTFKEWYLLNSKLEGQDMYVSVSILSSTASNL